MKELTTTPLFGIVISLVVYEIALLIQKKTKFVLFNPLLVSTIIIISILLFFHIPLDNYKIGADFIQMMQIPVTAILALQIYRQKETLKEYFIPVIGGCTVGSFASMGSILLMGKIFDLDGLMVRSLVPKSVTAPIAMEVSKTISGEPSLTVAAVVITGILGMVFAPVFIKIFRIKNAVAAGVAIGTCSHALGSVKAIEIGEVEGALSSVAMGVSGIVTVIMTTIAILIL